MAQEEVNESADQAKAQLTILVVDDQESVRTTLVYLLRMSGYDAIGAESGPKALGLAATDSVAGALIDVHMPVMNGFESVHVRVFRHHGHTARWSGQPQHQEPFQHYRPARGARHEAGAAAIAMKILAFIKSPAGSVALFACLAAVGGLLIHRSNARERARAAQLTKLETNAPASRRESIVRTGQPLKVPARAVPAALEHSTPTVASERSEVSRPLGAREGRGDRSSPPKPRVLPISLVAIAAVDGSPALSKTYAPFGRLIPCETVITIESSKLDTPVIGLVTEDVWHNGELIVPAGAEVHGRASLDRARERIAVSGKWVVVWRDGSPLNGTELVLNGIALDRAKDDVTGEFGLRDGSAGLLGQLVKTDDWQEIKLFASTFLAGFAGGLQELQNQGTAFGGIAQVPVASGRTAALRGTSDVLNAYARQIQEAIARDGFFARVPAGKQFYLYVTETVDVAKGTRGNVANAEIWRKQNEK